MRAGIVVEQNKGDSRGRQEVARTSRSLDSNGVSSIHSEMLELTEAVSMALDWIQGKRKRKMKPEQLVDDNCGRRVRLMMSKPKAKATS